MMKKLNALIVVGLLLCIPFNIFALDLSSQEEDVVERLMVLREAKQHRKTSVAVEAYLVGDILEVTVIARMYAVKPRIFSMIIVGPGLNRISAKERRTLYSKVEGEEAAFPTEDRGGFIRFSEKTKDKKLKGTLTRELHKFKIPADKIIPNKRYQLWVKVESMRKSGKITNFKFDLKELPQLISKK